MEKYRKDGVVGTGTFGIVYKAFEKASGRQVALKKIRLGQLKDGVSFTALREIKLLQELQHENLIKLFDVFGHNANINLVFEFMDWDLEKIIKERTIILSGADIKSYMQQLLKGLDYCHKNWILHRDLKPSNLLLGPDGVLKLADFGLARSYGSPNAVMTNTVVTRWYRAPELLFGARNYSHAIDIWSVGCIFAELMLRTPYFPGDSDIDQLGKIFSALGTPDEQIWPGITSLPDYVPYTQFPATPYRALFTAASDDAIDLLSKMLKYDPNERLSAEAALKHPYFSSDPLPTPPNKLPKLPMYHTSNEDLPDVSPLKRSSAQDSTAERPSSRRRLDGDEDTSSKKRLMFD